MTTQFNKCMCCRSETLRPFPISDFSWCTFCGTIQGIVGDQLQIEIPDRFIQELEQKYQDRLKENTREEPLAIFKTFLDVTDVMWVLGEDDQHFKGIVPGRKDEFDIELFRQDDYEGTDASFWQWHVVHETDRLPHICSAQGVAEKLENARVIAAKMVHTMLKAPLDHPEEARHPGHQPRSTMVVDDVNEFRDQGEPEEEGILDRETRCSVCGEPQFDTFHGTTCKNGHGGAPPQ